MTEVEITQQVQFTPQSLEFFIMKDHELAEIIVSNSDDINTEQISMVCGWWDNKGIRLFPDCLKSSKPVMRLSNEKDFITSLVQQNVLPEGNYMIIVT